MNHVPQTDVILAPNRSTSVPNKTRLIELTYFRYYLLYGDNIKAFPADFAMIAGDTFQRTFDLPIPDPPLSEWNSDPQQSSQSALAKKALGFNCLNYAVQPPEGSLYRHFMPDKGYLDAHCTDGLRFELMFPSCWNEAAGPTSHNYKDHMAYPDLVKTGTCPNGFGTRVPSLFYETIYDTYSFLGKAGQFVLANGDPTGNNPSVTCTLDPSIAHH